MSASQRFSIAMGVAARADIAVHLDLRFGYAVACPRRGKHAVAVPLHHYTSNLEAGIDAIRGALAVAGQPHLISDLLHPT